MVEVGLGGRLDSTNIVMGEIAIVTNIELEHTRFSGKTRAAIAREKVGILKPGATLITPLDPDDEAGRVLEAKADELGAPIVRARPGAAATIVETNVALAGAALDQLGKLGVRATVAGGGAAGAWLLDAETCAAARLPAAWSVSTSRSGGGACRWCWTARTCRSISRPSFTTSPALPISPTRAWR